MAATPHANLDYSLDPELVSRKIEELRAAAGPLPRIHRGCDFHLSYDNIQDAIENPAKYTINNLCYLLVEFSDLLVFRNTGDIFERLLEAGMVPIITHPERNWLLQQRLAELRAWAGRGVLLQVTAASLTGRFGRGAARFARTLLNEGLVHFIASDAHDPEDRTPDMTQARELIARDYGEEWADLLFAANPRRALDGEPIEPCGVPVPKRRSWYRFW
jgi:protein-tyrosine phosphatase